MHINRLPCLVFRLIFSKLSFGDVLQAGRVCLLWREYQMQITNKVTCVTLLICLESNRNQSFSPLGLIERSLFFIPHRDELVTENGSPLFASQLGPDWSRLCISSNLDLSTTISLIKELPNVTALHVSINYSDSSVLDHVILLLNNWKHHLSTFKFWCHFNGRILTNLYNSNQLRKLFLSLNSLANLEYLTLDINHGYSRPDGDCISDSIKLESFFRDDLVFLSRLREFYFQFYNSYATYSFYQRLKEICVSNTRLEHIGFDLILSTSIDLHRMPLARKISFIPSPSFYLPPESFWTYMNPFTSLTTLDIKLSLPLPEVINKLSMFKQLIHLSITQSPFQVATLMSKWDHIAQHAIPQLLSVKILSLRLNIVEHSDLESSHWAWIFPSVQVLSVDHECTGLNSRGLKKICQFSYMKEHGRIVTQEHVNECIRELLLTFKPCPKLRRIYLNESNIPTSQFTRKFTFML